MGCLRRGRRPANAIGISAVRLLDISGNVLRVGELDILDGTPVLDIKPYVSQYDSYPTSDADGWAAKPSGQT